MDLSKPSTQANLEAAFGGESMANRKYLFFADVAKKLGRSDLAKLFRDTAAQETEHAFAGAKTYVVKSDLIFTLLACFKSVKKKQELIKQHSKAIVQMQAQDRPQNISRNSKKCYFVSRQSSAF